MTPPPKSPVVCECLEITEAELIKQFEKRVMRTLKDVIGCTSAGEGCTACHPLLRQYLERQRTKEARAAANPSSRPLNSPKDSSAALSA